MKIHELFLKSVDRSIDGVIKADDQRNIAIELEEYVVTTDVANGIGILTERYLNELTANGVWISGFFGSGKSHLLKILSLVLDGVPHPSGLRPADIIIPKIDDEFVKASLKRAVAIPSRSILFNIDQKFDGVGGDHSAAILEVFIKVLNELQGYYGKQGYIAQFEHDLDVRHQFKPFQDTYLQVNGTSWITDRGAIQMVRKAAFEKAYAAHFSLPETDGRNLLRQLREDYRVSIESLAQRVKEYIDRQPPGFRLNFFIDEVGQFIGQDRKLMLNLQTVTETLGTVCSGRAWVFATSQSDLEGVIGAFRGMDGQDISKIMERFKTRLTLASAGVQEVIQKRLLAKKEKESAALTVIYEKEKDNFQTLFRFGDESKNFKGWRDPQHFCGLYPFHPYQFELFQIAIKQLSDHNAFTGKYLSVGERSMIAVFQEVAKRIKDVEVGGLGTFDMLYDGISASIRGDMQATVKLGERQLGEGLEVKILKSLFLLKWVRDFKATPRNIAILLIDQPEMDIRAHEKAVREALTVLESQSFLQRNGEAFEFLTDTEKDIEVEIKTTEIDEGKVSEELSKILFTEVLRDPKIRYEGNGQDYVYERKVDDQRYSRGEAEVSIHIITAENQNHNEVSTLVLQNSGKAELLAILPADSRLTEQVRLYLKTKKYTDQNSGGVDETRKNIINQRAQQNSARRNKVVELAAESLGIALLYINGSKVTSVGEGKARNRFLKASQELIAFAFPNLKMLKEDFNEASLSKVLLEPEGGTGELLQTSNEAEQEVLTYVTRNQNQGERISVEEIIRYLGRRPYGWYPMAVLTLLGRLSRTGKVVLRDTEDLHGREALEKLKNSRLQGSVRVRLQENYDPLKVNELKVFYHDFFDEMNPGMDARSVAKLTSEAFAAESMELSRFLQQSNRYRFLDQLKPIVENLNKLSKMETDYLLNHCAEFRKSLIDAKNQIVSPLKAFMQGAQRQAYDDITSFYQTEEANLSELSSDEVQPLRELVASPEPYRNHLIPAAKNAVLKIRERLNAVRENVRTRVLVELAAKEGQIQSLAKFAELDESARKEVLSPLLMIREEIVSLRYVAGMRDLLQRYTTKEYPNQLTLVEKLSQKEVKTSVVLELAEGAESLVERPVEKPVQFRAVSELRPQCSLPYIATPPDLDVWLTALRCAAQEELDNGYRILI